MDTKKQTNDFLSQADKGVFFFFWYVSDPDKHYLMHEHERVPIAVCERQPSSIIAFALRYSFLYMYN